VTPVPRRAEARRARLSPSPGGRRYRVSRMVREMGARQYLIYEGNGLAANGIRFGTGNPSTFILR